MDRRYDDDTTTAQRDIAPLRIPVHTQWKKQVAALPEAFAPRRGTADRDQQAVQAALYEEIGRLKVELDVKKKHETADRRAAVDPTHPSLSVIRCALCLDRRSTTGRSR